MAREKEHFRDVLADVVEVTGKRILGVNDIAKYLHIGKEKARREYLGSEKKITAHKFASMLL